MIQQGIGWGRRYWVFIATLLLLALAFGVSAPAWAAPPSSTKYQTVPKPTPTAGADPVATATPRPDGGDSGGSGSETGGAAPSDREVPAFVIAGESAVPASGLTATVTVVTLNVREGPGVDYPVVGSLSAGDVVNVLWRNAENTWLYVCCIPGTELGGWVSAQLLSLDFDRATSADVIPVYADAAAGAPVAGAASAQAPVSASDSPTATVDATLPLQLKVNLVPRFLSQGETGQLNLQVSNPNLEDALDVEVSDQLPPQLELVSASASGEGAVTQQTAPTGEPIVLATWDRIPAGEDVRLKLTVRVVESLDDGVVFDNLAAAQGSNTGYASGSITIGMPPVLLPDFQ